MPRNAVWEGQSTELNVCIAREHVLNMRRTQLNVPDRHNSIQPKKRTRVLSNRYIEDPFDLSMVEEGRGWTHELIYEYLNFDDQLTWLDDFVWSVLLAKLWASLEGMLAHIWRKSA